MKRAVDAFGAPGVDNGVYVGFGAGNEVPKEDAAISAKNSPDGLIFQVTFDGDRLKGPSLEVATAHVGTHIADIRSTEAGLSNEPFYGAKFRAWQTSLLGAVVAKAKLLILPGGYTIYDGSWSAADWGKNANGAIAEFLANWANITNRN